jgi:hypothetical protein
MQMRVLEWVSTIPFVPKLRTISVLTLGETAGLFSPNLTVTVRDIEEGEDLRRHFEISKMVDSATTRVIDQRSLNLGTKSAMLQRAHSVTPSGTPIDQETLYFLVPPKAVIVTLSALQNTAGAHEPTLYEFVTNFEVV